MRYIPPSSTPWRGGTRRRCKAGGCQQTTREGKPYCSNHTGLNPYAMVVLEELERISRERNLVLLNGKECVDLKSTTAQEIIRVLRQKGTKTIAGLAKDLQLSEKLISRYLQAMKAEGIVTLNAKGKRKTVHATLVNELH